MRLSELNIPRSEIIRLSDEWILVARNKNIFLKKIEGYTYEELSEMFNLSTVRTKEIVKDCLDKISKHT
jgi:Mor family transcriptional regulator